MTLTRRKAIIGLCAAAMPTGRAASVTQTRLRISAPIGIHQKMLGELASRFTRLNPAITIEFVGKGDNWDPLLQVTLREGLVNGLPDATWQSLTYAPLLARRRYLQSLDALAGGRRAFNELGLPGPLLESVSGDRGILAMPFGTTIPVVYFNKDLLRRAGYTAAQPLATWDEIVEIAGRISALDQTLIGGFVEYDASNAWIFQNLVAGFGGRMMTSDLSGIAFDAPEGRSALELLWRLGDAGGPNMSREQARQAFNAGACGILIRSASGTTSVSKAAEGRFELMVGRLPLPSPNGRLVGAGHGFMVFTKDPDRQKALWAFLRFAAEAEGQMILARQTGYMPVNVSALADAAFRKEYLRINPYHSAIVDALEFTTDQFSFPKDNTVKITDMMADVMRDVVVHRTRPDAALKAMADQTRKLLSS
ncbi:extracellular solute-binding protein [Bradyrhizobium sp. DOA9]|uniref:extracellular solute-binding protein n=1 Tax=Bradyrhizobium sp. DOA9 TaxID=1126627 RepID=UPI000499965B|nr:extracellular solute-binding protein [Bradyrhizobium sp. DOA9]GAJ37494.1 glycerol-3-phosphate-binding periplasmic protein precursor [Bradyrhizobium sp. DOA9]